MNKIQITQWIIANKSASYTVCSPVWLGTFPVAKSHSLSTTAWFILPSVHSSTHMYRAYITHTSHIPLTYVHVNTEHTCYNTNTCTGDRPQRLYNVCVPSDRLCVCVYALSALRLHVFAQRTNRKHTKRLSHRRSIVDAVSIVLYCCRYRHTQYIVSLSAGFLRAYKSNVCVLYIY